MNDRLLAGIARRNLIFLCGATLVSVAWQSLPVTLGVLGGGLVSVGGYFWLYLSLKRLMADPTEANMRLFKRRYLVRLGGIAAALAVLIVIVRVHPLALAAGISLVVANLLWTTLIRVSRTEEIEKQ